MDDLQQQRNYLLENQMERAVLTTINELSLMETQGRFCMCEKFQRDVAAIALNHFFPRYATTFSGSLYTLDTIQSDEDLQGSLLREVAKAMELVVSDPRCLDPNCPIRMAGQPNPIMIDTAHIGDPEEATIPNDGVSTESIVPHAAEGNLS